MFGEIESFCALVDRVKKLFKSHSNPSSDGSVAKLSLFMVN